MNASEAKKLTEDSKPNQIAPFDLFWVTARVYVDKQIRLAAEQGNSTVQVNMKSVEMEPMNKHLALLKERLKNEGFEVDYLIARTPNGTRKMILKW